MWPQPRISRRPTSARPGQRSPLCPKVSGGVLWSWADYYHRRHFQANGQYGAFGAVTIDRRPKAALKVLAEMYGAAFKE